MPRLYISRNWQTSHISPTRKEKLRVPGEIGPRELGTISAPGTATRDWVIPSSYSKIQRLAIWKVALVPPFHGETTPCSAGGAPQARKAPRRKGSAPIFASLAA